MSDNALAIADTTATGTTELPAVAGVTAVLPVALRGKSGRKASLQMLRGREALKRFRRWAHRALQFMLNRSCTPSPPPGPEMARSPRFPQEIFDIILEYLWAEPLLLEECCRVCKAWLASCRQLVSQTPTLRSLDDLKALNDIYKNPKTMHRLKQMYHLTLREQDGSRWLHLLPGTLGHALSNVQYLCLEDWHVHALHPSVLLVGFPQLQNVTLLDLRSCIFESFSQFRQLICGFPLLYYLALGAVYIQKNARCTPSPFLIPPPKLTAIQLYTPASGSDIPARSNVEFVAHHFADWLLLHAETVKHIKELYLHISLNQLQKDELKSIGGVIKAISPHIQRLVLQLNSNTDTQDWEQLQIQCCKSIYVVEIWKGSSDLWELKQLSPECQIEFLNLGHWQSQEQRSTNWALLSTALQAEKFSKLKQIRYTRVPQSLEEEQALSGFIQEMEGRKIEFLDKRKCPARFG